jgi:hypothetical protein
VHDVHERLREIRDELKRWTASGRGLLVLSHSEAKEREEEWLRTLEERRREEPGEDQTGSAPGKTRDLGDGA